MSSTIETQLQRINDRLATLEATISGDRPPAAPEPVITLELTPKQAFWLKALTQNYIAGPGAPEDESADELAIRAAIFDQLPSFDALIGLPLQQGG